ncbi:hypothetical protein GPL15_17095 [Clostridium sp. MCC353]|uniref:NPCBM/NEW2 domain-containing protein n=1 Tax=Clostridium sp. MCC353 TaxID=2592646 RepID=UPI0023E02F31|nr:NPCBM/NEW2 domain-containing protein [Clostridium sp. MCC353]MBT9778220.1 hypothetical protein [Clostridium sp. MCC353]
MMKKRLMKKAVAAGLTMIMAAMTVFPAYADWQQSGNQWKYESGGRYLTGWQTINATWYYFDGNGVMLTGWQAINGAWFYFRADGSMVFDQWIGNYYVGSNGAMATNTWIGPYYVGSDGAWIPNYGQTGSSGAGATNNQETKWLTDLDYLSKDSVITKDSIKDNFGTSYKKCIKPSDLGYGDKNIVYYLGGKYDSLTATFALSYDYRNEANDEVAVTIYADGDEIYSSSPIGVNDYPEEIDVNISGCEQLEILFTGAYKAHYFLGDVKLYK